MNSTSLDIISPEYYHPTNEPDVYAVDKELKENLHCQFVTALHQEAEKLGWILRMVPEGTPDAGFPEVCLIPPGQDGESVLHSIRVDAGIPDELRGDEINRRDVDRIIKFAVLKQRAFAGPVEVNLPSILVSKPFATFRGRGEGAYDPVQWAEVSMRLAKILWDEGAVFQLFEK